MVSDWLADAVAIYNDESHNRRDEYVAQVHFPARILEDILGWALKALPDEILVGLDVSMERNLPEVEVEFQGSNQKKNLFAGQGYRIHEAKMVNRGDSFSVHHLPEEWTDEVFGSDRGPRAGRFTHWLHTHPNCPAIPSHADADAAQSTDGVDLILGIEFSPEGPLPWFDDIEGERRIIGEKKSWFSKKDKRQVLGVAPTGHRIHSLELIAFHKAGLGVNVVFVNDDGIAY
jgi:proteasome lid subunit RPN8/RPN11